MKLKTTKNEILKQNKKIIKVGYCALQNLLHYKNPIAYTAGVNGWNADIYEVEGVLICTGYRPFGNIEIDYEKSQKIDKEAQEILYGKNDIKWDDKKTMIDGLLKNFIKEASK